MKFSHDERERIKKHIMMNSHLSNEALARNCFVSTCTIFRYRRQLTEDGLIAHKGPYKCIVHDAEVRQQIENALKTMSRWEASKHFGVSESTIYRIASMRGTK